MIQEHEISDEYFTLKVLCDGKTITEYAAHHERKLFGPDKCDIGFFHMKEWMEARGIICIHKANFRSWRIDKFLIACLAVWLYPYFKRVGQTNPFYK